MRFISAPLFALFGLASLSAEPVPPDKAENIVYIGSGLGERMLDHPWLETELQLRYPGMDLVIRNMCRPGDTPGFRPHPSRKSQWAFPGAEKFRPQNAYHAGVGTHPTPDEWLSEVHADTILGFFGYNESFDGPEGLELFKGELKAFIDHTKAQKYNGKDAPRLVLVSPVAYEDLSAQRDLPNGEKENANLKLYTDAMREISAAEGIDFIDLFAPTSELFAPTDSNYTSNGFLPNDEGYKFIGPILANGAFGEAGHKSKADPEELAKTIVNKNWFWTHDFRMPNGVHVDGRRYNPFGPKNYPAEIEKIRSLTAIRDQAVWAKATGNDFDIASADRALPPLPEVETNYKPSEKNGTTEYKYGKDALDSLTVPEGYKIEMFASEKEFPNLENPSQISFDNKGRLWVACMPTYPHYRPGDGMPDDKLLIYEDTDGDGRADKETVFADNLHLPIGFEFALEGVYVAQTPHLVLLRDTDGDDRADSSEVIITGFDSHDTHHAASAFCADASGSFMLCEGRFLHSNVESPYGPVRAVEGGFFRFSPQRTKLERTAQVNISNPWGFAYDKWGQDFALETSGPRITWLLPISPKPNYGGQAKATVDLAPKGNAVRPTSGLEFVSSGNFPDDVQGDMLLCNNIGFLGIKQHKIEDDGTGFKTTHRQDLLVSSDGNFRPSDLEFAPDGSLYVSDWHNVLIGHMQHNARDPLRDHVHGRVYRISYTGRPLTKPAPVAGASVSDLLDNLKDTEYRTRYRTRRELRAHPANEVLPALAAWVEKLDKNDSEYEHHLLEALWTTWAMNDVDSTLLHTLLKAKDPHARAAAVRVLRYNYQVVDGYLDLLKAAANDSDGRVRLEAVIAASWVDTNEAMEVVEIAEKHPLDVWSKGAVKTVSDRLTGVTEKVVDENPVPKPPQHLTAIEKKRFKKGHEIYFRDGHCVTCHQPDAKGLPGSGFPPLYDSPWVHGEEERIIKLTLHGLMGPIEVKGVKYPGQVPMTPFGGMLDDEEVASVLTYVRNTFGNKASAVTPEDVAKVRKETGTRGFYSPDELLKDHPHDEK
ncbi:PVC-type heme-binding CxxCH protein [Luteolibacter algae]|uniref:PVC-type heme-binding CxxCH protein n=1 Tax=Luteolibacter algae TaxID=454151 RepID=A0ABW5D6N9_9BACT